MDWTILHAPTWVQSVTLSPKAAAKSNAISKVEACLEFRNGITDLMKAASHGNLQAVQTIVESGAEIDRRDDFGRPALYYAINSGQQDVVCYLLNQGADVTFQVASGISPLYLALKRQHEHLIPFILRALLWRAARHGLGETLESILAEGETGVDDRTEQGWTALMLAAAQGHLEAVRVLLKNGANPTLYDRQGWTAENYAAYHGHTQLARLLSRHKAETVMLAHAA